MFDTNCAVIIDDLFGILNPIILWKKRQLRRENGPHSFLHLTNTKPERQNEPIASLTYTESAGLTYTVAILTLTHGSVRLNKKRK